MPLIQSAMALRTVSIQSPSLAEMVDKGLEEIQEKNNVGQKLHNSTAFHGWVDKNAAWALMFKMASKCWRGGGIGRRATLRG